MRARTWIVVTAAGFALMAAGCATPQQWETWRSHNSHFASGDHLWFSVVHSPSRAHVEGTDVDNARSQGGWWGRALGGPEGAPPAALPAK
jgi:hypothetical protein